MAKVNLFIVGAAKAGTTSIYELLKTSKSIKMSCMKEPHYFSKIKPDNRGAAYIRYVTSAEQYGQLFDAEGSFEYFCDASTSYILKKSTLEEIYSYNPDAKIIMCIRNPIERAFSHFLNDVRDGYRQNDFNALLREELKTEEREWSRAPIYIELGMYAKRIRWCQEIFGNNSHLIVYDDIANDQARVRAELEDFLGLKIQADKLPHANPHRTARACIGPILKNKMAYKMVKSMLPAGIRKIVSKKIFKVTEKPTMKAEDREFLVNIYRNELAELEVVLGRKLAWH